MAGKDCCVCKKNLGMFEDKYKIKSGYYICTKCLKRNGGNSRMMSLAKMSSDEFEKEIVKLNQNEVLRNEMVKKFTPTKKIDYYIYVDENKKQWCIPQSKDIRESIIHSYDEIINFELLEDGESIIKGGLGSAVAGGLLFGGVGAVVGSATGGKKTKQLCTSLQIKITLNNIQNPVEYITFLSYGLYKYTDLYKKLYSSAQEVLSLLQVICESLKSQTNSSTTEEKIDPIEEVKKFKELLDSGIISQEEFDKKKKELLKL